jgi:hypothetical protein
LSWDQPSCKLSMDVAESTNMKDLASVTSSPPAEFTADSYLMRNCLEFP